MPAYEYLAYLRHHGFPSPFLDWTASPYIATFFAYRDIPNDAEHVSVFCYQEYAGSSKVGSSDKPYIHTLGPYAPIHNRHFLQQSSYTLCAKWDLGDFLFTNHGEADAQNTNKQDLLWKFNLPVSEREKIKTRLNKMNITAYSLFGSIDSLMEALAFSEQERL